MIRLNKYLSEAGVCSRREADRLIESGIVTVDGKTAAPGMKVEDGQEVRVGKKVVKSKTEKTVLAVYKPAGIVCTEDKREKKNIIRFPSRTRWLRPKRPMVLYWRRYGRAGGCRIYKKQKPLQRVFYIERTCSNGPR